MLSWAGVLRQGKLSEERTRRALEIIEQSGRMQARMIEDMLDVSRIVAGRLSIDRKLVDLQIVARTALDALHADAVSRGLRVEARFEEAVPVHGDPLRLQQIVSNLLSNALKFTPSGGTVELSVARAGRDARIVVRDSGVGIAPAFLSRIFEPFSQADNGNTRKGAGLGLGLSIVKSLVEEHEGRVSATSEGEGEGATFTVTLPICEVPRSQEA
jgi:signal transduction histidine kinase